MKQSAMWRIFLVAVTACACDGDTLKTSNVAGPNLSEDPLTVTPSGSIRGSWQYTRRGRALRAYRGVRYAQPPVRERRFQPPELITKYEGEVNATLDGPACPQPVYDDYYVDEDCLRLNVYTPAQTKSPLPVVVFMHAGGFYSVSGRSDIAGPSYLLDKDIVLVTINYRLASLGFLSTGDEHAPGNNGFKDQVAALRWVQRNIAAFGGNPELVTIAGYSAGSFSVALHMVSPMSKGLFHRAISMSGSPISQIPLPHDLKKLAIKQADLVGCPTHSSKAIVECLKTKTSTELGNSLDSFFEYAYDPVLVWTPVVERDCGQERFLLEHPLLSLQAGRLHAVPYIISQTTDEFSWKAFSILKNETLTEAMDREWHRMAPISFQLPPSAPAADRLREFYLGSHNHGHLTNDSETARNLGKLYSDGIIGFGAHTLVNAIAVYSPEAVYYNEFAYIGNSSHYVNPDTGKPTGAAHHDDLLYLFSVNVSFPLIPAGDTRDSQMVDLMTDIWHKFATNGDPSMACPAWPRFTHSHRQYLRIHAQPLVRERLFKQRFQVWEKLYSPDHCDYCTY